MNSRSSWAVFAVLCCCCCLPEFVSAKETHLYLTLKTKFQGSMNFSYGLSRKSGLTTDEKQAILDMINALRAKLGSGNEPHTMGGPAPLATNMLAMEWDDAIADYAQHHASKCPSNHSSMNITQSNYTQALFSENMSGGPVAIDRDMYGEIRDWNYRTQKCKSGQQCGHYIYISAWSHFRVGCGYHSCKSGGFDKTIVVCIFAPYNSGALELKPTETRYKHQYEYWTGAEPCSECPQGWDYCMGGGLCATKAQCDSDPNNKCVCKNSKKVCEGNGGQFDAANCRCKCPSTRHGRNCAQKCEDLKHESACGQTCGGGMLELFHCYKACDSCGKSVSRAYIYWMQERKTRNKHNLKVRVKKPAPQVPKNVVTSSLPGRGTKCKNRESDYICEVVRAGKYCIDYMDNAKWEHYCSASCNTCGSKKFTNLLNKAAFTSPSEAAKWGIPVSGAVTSTSQTSNSGWTTVTGKSASTSGGGWAPAKSSTTSGGGWNTFKR